MNQKKIPEGLWVVALWVAGLYVVITALLVGVAISHHLWREFFVTQAALVAAAFAAIILLRSHPEA